MPDVPRGFYVFYGDLGEILILLVSSLLLLWVLAVFILLVSPIIKFWILALSFILFNSPSSFPFFIAFYVADD